MMRFVVWLTCQYGWVVFVVVAFALGLLVGRCV